MWCISSRVHFNSIFCFCKVVVLHARHVVLVFIFLISWRPTQRNNNGVTFERIVCLNYSQYIHRAPVTHTHTCTQSYGQRTFVENTNPRVRTLLLMHKRACSKHYRHIERKRKELIMMKDWCTLNYKRNRIIWSENVFGSGANVFFFLFYFISTQCANCNAFYMNWTGSEQLVRKISDKWRNVGRW